MTGLLTALMPIALLVLGVSSVNAAAGATPYRSSSGRSGIGTAISLQLSTTTPVEGATLTAHGSGAAPGETATISLPTRSYPLGTATADSIGDFTLVLNRPSGVTGAPEISAVGASSGLGDSVSIDISGVAAASSSRGDGLSSVGVAVVGMGALGMVLFIGRWAGASGRPPTTQVHS